jgi:hypothetical protein
MKIRVKLFSVILDGLCGGGGGTNNNNNNNNNNVTFKPASTKYKKDSNTHSGLWSSAYMLSTIIAINRDILLDHELTL